MSDIVWSINPSKDHLSDLTQRMRRFASDSLSAKGITFQFNFSEIEQEVVVKSHLRREVFLIFKESINNIVKHSAAAQVKIKLQISDEFLTLKIFDNGKGFDSEKAYENSLSSISMGKNGILSMQKRAEEINGELEIVSKVGTGTTIELRLPMEIGQTQAPNR
jgi:signal transduction histidine kinase